MADPQSKADVDPNFETRLRDLQAAAKAEVDGRTGSGQVRWARPAGWAGSPFDLAAMHDPFDRAKANADFLAAVKDPEAPGTTGDVVATLTMIDTLAQLEAAFRMRHTMRRPRAMALALARKKGHGDDRGPLVQCGLEYVREILKGAKTQG